ncbi:hypothetical protein BC629DRAFT_1438933 [Irpex lacteus]|nr:hypothetical protein BC629DRAFT_1438933 [Irpex lacteus]
MVLRSKDFEVPCKSWIFTCARFSRDLRVSTSVPGDVNLHSVKWRTVSSYLLNGAEKDPEQRGLQGRDGGRTRHSLDLSFVHVALRYRMNFEYKHDAFWSSRVILTRLAEEEGRYMPLSGVTGVEDHENSGAAKFSGWHVWGTVPPWRAIVNTMARELQADLSLECGAEKMVGLPCSQTRPTPSRCPYSRPYSVKLRGQSSTQRAKDALVDVRRAGHGHPPVRRRMPGPKGWSIRMNRGANSEHDSGSAAPELLTNIPENVLLLGAIQTLSEGVVRCILRSAPRLKPRHTVVAKKVQPPKNLDTHLAARLALNASASRFAQPSMESKYASWGTASESYSNTRSHHNARRFSVKLEIKLAGSPKLQDNDIYHRITRVFGTRRFGHALEFGVPPIYVILPRITQAEPWPIVEAWPQKTIHVGKLNIYCGDLLGVHSPPVVLQMSTPVQHRAQAVPDSSTNGLTAERWTQTILSDFPTSKRTPSNPAR